MMMIQLATQSSMIKMSTRASSMRVSGASWPLSSGAARGGQWRGGPLQGAKRGGSASARMIENHCRSSVHSSTTPQPAARSISRLSR